MDARRRSYRVTGDGYAARGGRWIRHRPATGSPSSGARIAAACNDATLMPPDAAGRAWTITGDPTEGALIAFAAQARRPARPSSPPTCPRVAELTFDAGAPPDDDAPPAAGDGRDRGSP